MPGHSVARRGLGLLATVSLFLAACSGAATTPAAPTSPPANPAPAATSAPAVAAPATSAPVGAPAADSAPKPAAPTAAPAPTSAPAAAPSGPVPPLKVGGTSLTVALAELYIAKAEGFFDQAGVDVTIQDAVGGNLTNLLVSGQIDLGMGAIATALVPAAEGKATTVVYGYQGNAAGGFLIGKKGYTSIQDVKKIGAGLPPSAIFGYCNYFKKALNASFDCVPLADFSARRAAFQSGQVDAIMDTWAQLSDFVDAGNATILFDARDPEQRRKFVGSEDFSDAGIFGMTDNLTAKKESVTRFMKGLVTATKWIDSHSDEDVAVSMRKIPSYQTFTLEQLAKQEKDYRAFNHPNQGYITEASWTAALANWSNWQLGAAFDNAVKTPVMSYQQRVDMSYYENGAGKPPAR